MYVVKSVYLSHPKGSILCFVLYLLSMLHLQHLDISLQATWSKCQWVVWHSPSSPAAARHHNGPTLHPLGKARLLRSKTAALRPKRFEGIQPMEQSSTTSFTSLEKGPTGIKWQTESANILWILHEWQKAPQMFQSTFSLSEPEASVATLLAVQSTAWGHHFQATAQQVVKTLEVGQWLLLSGGPAAKSPGGAEVLSGFNSNA